MIRRPPRSTRTDTLFPYPTLFRSSKLCVWQALDRMSLPFKWIAGIFLPLLLLAGCEKEDFTRPSSFELKLSAPEAPVMGGSLAFTQMVLQADEIGRAHV